MLKNTFNYFTMFITGLFFCVLGISLIFHKLDTWNWLYSLFIIGILALTVIRIFNIIINFRKVKHLSSQLFELILWILLVLISITYPSLFRTLMPRLIGVWLFLHAVAKGIVLYIKKKDKLSGQLKTSLFFCWDIIMASVLLFLPYKLEYIISYGVGAYFCIHGASALLNMIREVLPKNSGTKLDTRIRLGLPTYLAAIIPPKLIKIILDKDEDELIREEFDTYKANIPIDLEVMVHLAPSGPASFGHVDLIYKDMVFSYGCYDPHNRRLCGTLGDGVMLIAPREAYLNNCLENENKVLIGFGIILNTSQKELIEQHLLDICQDIYDFKSDEQLKREGLSYKGECDDYLSRVTRKVPHAKYYKFHDKRFKTFFVLSSNCVYFASQVLNKIGLNLVDLSGVVSPGSYFDFLNNQFKSDRGFVISRKIYRKND